MTIKLKACDFLGLVPMILTIKTLTGRKVQYDVNDSTTFRELKEDISNKEGIEVPQIRMIFGGHMVNDLQTIAESGIKGGDILHLVLSLRGG
jgi:general stress protein YciG